LKRVEAKVRTKLKDELMVTPEIELLEPSSLPRTTGKAKRVIDRREI